MLIKFFNPYKNKEKVKLDIITNDFYKPLYKEVFWYREGREISFFTTFYEVYLESQNVYPELIKLSSEELRGVVLRLVQDNVLRENFEVAGLWENLFLTMKGSKAVDERSMTIVYLTYFQKISWYLIKHDPSIFRQVKARIDWEKFLGLQK